jgi:hypothetical protein
MSRATCLPSPICSPFKSWFLGGSLGAGDTPTLEHRFESGLGTLRSPTGPISAWVGRAGAATERNLVDSSGQQGITNLEVSGRSERLTWAAKPPE